jgi:predicted O-methyltransferase YrrM
MPQEYEFSVDWFTPHWANWLNATQNLQVAKVLEIGSFEGRSTCKILEEFGSKAPLEIHCADTWAGGIEHQHLNMNEIETRFDRNVQIAQERVSQPTNVIKHKGFSISGLLNLLNHGHAETFDIVFVDGSHRADDVLTDLVLSYQLCKIGGIIICDDYLWSMEPHGEEDVLNRPKLAIDAFSTIFARKVRQFSLPLYQVYFRRTS